MDFLFNAYNLLTSSAALLPVVVLLAVLSLWLIYRKSHYAIERAVEINALALSLAHLLEQDHGNPKRHYELLREVKAQTESIEDVLQGHIPLCQKHFQDIDKLTDKTLPERCPVDSCPAWLRISNGYKDLQARLEIFEITAAESRNRTADSLKEVSASVTKTSNELSSLATEIIGTIRDGRVIK